MNLGVLTKLLFGYDGNKRYVAQIIYDYSRNNYVRLNLMLAVHQHGHHFRHGGGTATPCANGL